MLSGAGEVAALTLPIHGAYWIGMAGTIVLAWKLADRTSVGLAWVSRVLLCVLAVMIIMGFRQPAAPAIVIRDSSLMKSVAGGFAYGGFNAALQVSILAENEKHKDIASAWKYCPFEATYIDQRGNALCQPDEKLRQTGILSGRDEPVSRDSFHADRLSARSGAETAGCDRCHRSCNAGVSWRSGKGVPLAWRGLHADAGSGKIDELFFRAFYFTTGYDIIAARLDSTSCW